MRLLSCLLLIGFLILLSQPVSTHSSRNGENTAGVYIKENSSGSGVQSSCVALTGDIMMGSFYPDSTLLPHNDGNFILRYISGFFEDADILCGNLEGVLADTGGTPKRLRYPDSAYYFKMPVHYAGRLRDAGYDFVSLANNHIFDFGAYGKNMTKKALDNAGVLYAGLTEAPFCVKTKNGLRYGFIAFAPNSGTLDLKNIPHCAGYVKMLATCCDIVIVSFHGGGEGSEYRNVKRDSEIYMGENRGNVYEFTHQMVDAGADIVFGHGPHLTRAVELYKDRLIMYSLGNFCTYGQVNKSGIAGIAPIIKVYTDNSGAFLSGNIIPVKQIRKGIPVYDHTNAVIKEMRQLTWEDFPETPLSINDDGLITAGK